MGNLTENRLNATIAATEIAAINATIASITTKLPVASLDDSQRSAFKAMDVNNKIFTEDVLTELAVSGAGIVPPYINATFIGNDMALYEQMDGIEAALQNLLQKVTDIKRIAGHEAYTAALSVYRMYDAANNAGIPGAKQGYDKLRERFLGSGRPADPEL